MPYFIPKECIVKTDNLSGYEPDVIVVSVSIQLARGQHSANNEEFLIWLKEYTLVVTFNSLMRLISPSSE